MTLTSNNPKNQTHNHSKQILHSSFHSTMSSSNNNIQSSNPQQELLQGVPPMMSQSTVYSGSNNNKLRNFNRSYIEAHNLVPRRPIYSASRVENSIKHTNNHGGSYKEKFMNVNSTNDGYLNLAQPLNLPLSDQTRFSDQTRLNSGSYFKNYTNNLHKSDHHNSSESFQPNNIDRTSQNSSRMKALKFLQTPENNILNRKSAFQVVKNNNENVMPHQIIPSVSSGASSTTSSVSSSISNSAGESSCIKNTLLKDANSKSNETSENSKSACTKLIPDSIRSGSVSSARSIYELRLKSLNESNMQALVESNHRINTSGNTFQKNQNFRPNERNFQSVKLEKYPKRRTHLSDNDFLEVVTSNNNQSSQIYRKSESKTNPEGHFMGQFSNSNKVLNKYVWMTPRASLCNDTEDKRKMMMASQRRLSYHAYKNTENQHTKLQNRQSMCIGNTIEIEDDFVLDGAAIDLEYGDDDIFGDEDDGEDLATYSDELVSPKPLNMKKTKEVINISNSSSTSPSSSSSLISNSSGVFRKQTNQSNQNNVPQFNSKIEESKTDLAYPHSISFDKSFILSTSSSSMSTSINYKPPQSPKPKLENVFAFPSIPQPPPLPSQANKHNNLSKVDFTITGPLQNFAHFDTQSVFFNYAGIKNTVDSLVQISSVNKKHQFTGASAASNEEKENNIKKNKDQVDKERPIHGSVRSRNGVLSISSVMGSMEQSSSVDEKSIAGDILKEQNFKESQNNRLSSSLFLYIKESENAMIRKINSSSSSLKAKETESTKLVEECNFFRLEQGGDVFKGLGLVNEVSERRMMKLNSVNILDKYNSFYKKDLVDIIETNANESFTVEFQDWGAYFYRFYFFNQDHANYLSVDPIIGPCALSIKREKLIIDHSRNYSTNGVMNHQNEKSYEYAYRLILRTSDLNTLRGTILEEHIDTKNPPGSKGFAHKDIINYLFPELDLTSLKLADSKVNERLIKIDESCLVKTHKIGVLLCKSGQSTEEEMYNNEKSTPAFEEFLQILGDKVQLKGFINYRGGLDISNDTTSTHSIHTKFRDKEIMFHVSTLLPYSNNDRQQLTRKRHIGNDLVTIIFQEPGAKPFSPKTIRSHFQHIFIIVRVIPNPNSSKTQYSVAVSYSTDVPSFGPPLPKNPLFFKTKEFREFLLAKIVNADSAGIKCDKFQNIKMRAQQGTLKELAANYSSKITLLNSNTITNSVAQKFSLFNFGSVKQKKTRSKSLQMFNNLLTESEEILSNSLGQLTGCIFWNIDSIEDFHYSLNKNCYIGISKNNIVIVDATKKSVLLTLSCNAIIGWTISEDENCFVLYYDQGECVNIKFRIRSNMCQVIKRLELYTRGCKTVDLSLEKKDGGLLGFSIHHDGVVTEVEMYSLAYYRGLKQGTRIVKINDYFVISLNHEKMIDILRKSACLKVTFLAPHEDGTVRRGQDETFAIYSYLSTCSSHNERLIDSNSISSTPQSIHSSMFSSHKKELQMSETKIPLNRNSNRALQSRQSTVISEINTRISTQNLNGKENMVYSNYAVNKHLNDLKFQKNHFRKSSHNNIIQQNKSEVRLSSTSSYGINNEWKNLVQTASKAYEDAQRKNMNTASDSLSNSTIKANNGSNIDKNPGLSSNYISTNEILANNPEVFKEIKKDFFQHKEKKISLDELKDTFIQMQIELNQQKHEKQRSNSRFRNILKENMTLKQEVYKLKDENSKLMYQTIYGSETSEGISYKLSSLDFAELNRDSSV